MLMDGGSAPGEAKPSFRLLGLLVLLVVFSTVVLSSERSFAEMERYSANASLAAQVEGQILDADDERILYVTPNRDIRILDRVNDVSTTILAQAGTNTTFFTGYLHPWGAIFIANPDGNNQSEVFDWRAGNLIELDPIPSRTLQTAGNYAVYVKREGLSGRIGIIRDLETGINTSIGLMTESLSLTDAGEVVYRTTDNQIVRYQSGNYQPVSTTYKNYGPKSDGYSAVYAKEVSNNNFVLIRTDFTDQIEEEIVDLSYNSPSLYGINNKWLAYVEETPSSSQNEHNLVIVSPSGQKQVFETKAFRINIIAVSPNGEVFYRKGPAESYIAKFGNDLPFNLKMVDTVHKLATYVGPYWYYIENDLLYSIDTSFYVPVQGFSFESSTYRIMSGIERFFLNPQFQPAKVSNWDIEWIEPTYHEIGSVYKEYAYLGTTVGEMDAVARTKDGNYVASVTLEVYYPARSISLPADHLTLSHPTTQTITPVLLPDYAGNQTVIWTSSNPDVAIIDANGTIQTVALGSTTITAVAEGGHNLQASMTVHVVSSEEDLLSFTGFGFVVSGTDYPAVIDETNKTVTITLPQTMFDSATHFLTHVRVNATEAARLIELTLGGKTTVLNYSGEEQLYAAQTVFGTEADPNGKGVPVCRCQQIIKQFPQFIMELSDQFGNKARTTYTIRLEFQ